MPGCIGSVKMDKKSFHHDFLSSKLNFVGADKLGYLFSDVYIDTETGAVLNKDLELEDMSLNEILYWNDIIPRNTLLDSTLLKECLWEKKAALREKIAQISEMDLESAFHFGANDQVIYMLHAFGWYPYGHLHDSLQRLFPWRDIHFNSPKILCSDYRRVVDFEGHISGMGYSPDSIVDSTSLPRLVFVPKLYFGMSPACPTTFTECSYNWTVEGYRKVFKIKDDRLPGIYLSRNGVKAGKRGVINDSQVQEILKNVGFTILNGSEPLSTIIDCFSRADKIVAPHGSLLANTIFSKKQAVVIEYCPENRPDYSFARKVKAVDNYHHILTYADEDFNLEIPIDGLIELLNRGN